MLNTNYLQRYIENIVKAFLDDVEIDYDRVFLQIESFRDHLDTMRGHYAGPLPAAAQPWQARILKGIDHYLEAFENLEEFLDEMDDELLKDALLESDSGDNELSEVIESIQQETQSGISHMMS